MHEPGARGSPDHRRIAGRGRPATGADRGWRSRIAQRHEHIRAQAAAPASQAAATIPDEPSGYQVDGPQQRLAGQLAAGQFHDGKARKVITRLAYRVRRRGAGGSGAMAASRLACASRCPHTARHAGPRRRPHPGPAARPCQRVAYDVPTRPVPGDQISRCRASRTRRAARPRGSARDDRIAGPRAPPAISFQAGIYADHAPSLHRSAGSVAKGDRHCSHERAGSADLVGNLVAQTAGSRRAELDVLRPVTPVAHGRANALDLPMSAHTRRDGPGCRSTGRSVVVVVRSATRTGLHVRSKRRCPASPAQVDAQTRVVRPPPGQVLLSAAGRLRSDAAGTSPSAISLAEHRVEFGVGPDLPDLLRAAAGDGDLGSPLQRLLA